MRREILLILLSISIGSVGAQSKGFVGISGGFLGTPGFLDVNGTQKYYQGVQFEYGRTITPKTKFFQATSFSVFYQYFKVRQNFDQKFFEGKVVENVALETGNNILGLKISTVKNIKGLWSLIGSLGLGVHNISMLGMGVSGTTGNDTSLGSISETSTAITKDETKLLSSYRLCGNLGIGVQFAITKRLNFQFMYQYFLIKYPKVVVDEDVNVSSSKKGSEFAHLQFNLSPRPSLFTFGLQYYFR